MATVFEEKAKLEAKIREDQTKLELLEKESKIAARTAHDDLIKAHGFSLKDLYPNLFSKPAAEAKAVNSPASRNMGGQRGKVKKRPASVLYANPGDASQKWTGRGIAPGWLTNAVKKGTIESFLVDGASHTKKIGELLAKKAGKAGKAAKKGVSAKKALKTSAKKSAAKKAPAKKASVKRETVKKLAGKKVAKKPPHIALKAPVE